jgi:hypothetical protein
VTRRITVAWPDEAAFHGREGAPIRLLAVSDDPDPALAHQRNRDALGTIDLVVGCGDLERDHLGFLGDAFRAPVVYILGNHDRGAGWEAGRRFAPDPLPDARIREEAGLRLIGLSWPGQERGRATRDELAAWRQAARVLASGIRHGSRPALILSHVPPRGAGDDPDDPYHRGFAAYRWIARRLRPPLWLHGHTTVASVTSTRAQLDDTVLLNVTGAVLVTLEPLTTRV